MKKLKTWLACAAFLTLHISLLAGSDRAKPAINRIWIEDKTVYVEVLVPVGLKTITLESKSTLDHGAWVPRVVERLDGQGGQLTLALPFSGALEMLRIKAVDSDPLPAFFYQGKKTFDGAAYAGAKNDRAFYGAPEAGGPIRNVDDALGDGGNREVSESDIWSISGDSLYFFNQLRGLQIVDLTTPANPKLQGVYPLPAAGEEMYLMGSDYVVLLARSGCSGGNESESQVLLINVSDPMNPSLAASLPVPGHIAESRMVGTALYVASNTYYYRTGLNEDRVWEYGTYISAFDLSDPLNPVKKEAMQFTGNSNVIQATPEYLMVAVRSSYWLDPATVHLVDISDPRGSMELKGSIKTAGYVADKFKMNIHGEVLTIISETRSRDNTRRLTLLENYSLQNPERPAKLGQVEVGHGESLFATRITRDRAYIVTFLRIDPLWIVDLSDPSNPVVTGELEIPGWSTFIYPYNDQLVTVGIDNENGWKVAVQLFDVSEPTRPTLLSKVPLGDDHSWSEANSNEKALTVLPESGLILVPYYEYSNQSNQSKIQLIDWSGDTLAARGVIEHEIQPRRADVYKDWILSISGRELLVVDAEDRNRPELVGDLVLSWPVDWVFPVDGYTLQLSANQYSAAGLPNPKIRVTDAEDPVSVLHEFELPDAYAIAGAERKGDKLYLLQNNHSYGWYVPEPVEGDENADDSAEKTVEPTWVLSVLDLSALPEVTITGRALVSDEESGYSSLMKARWIGNDRILWTGSGGYYGPWLRGGAAVDFIGDIRYPWWGGSQTLLAFSVADSAAPEFLSRLDLDSEQYGWNHSEAFVEGNLVYLSHQTSVFEEGILLPGQQEPKPEIVIDENGQKVERIPSFGIWVERHYLRVVDYSDPTAPTVRPKVNLPGVLKGISHDGQLLYTVGYQFDENFRSDYREWLDISAYDGVSASLVTSMELSQYWPHPILVHDGRVYSGTTNQDQSQNRIVTYEINQAGEWVKGSQIELVRPAQEFGILDDLLIISGGNGVAFADSDPVEDWKLIGEHQPEGCVWYQFDRIAGGKQTGLWFPLGDYGVEKLDIE